MAYAYKDYPTKTELMVRGGDARKADAAWQELTGQRRAKAEETALVDADGKKFWFVITPYLIHLIATIAGHRGFLDAVSLSPQVRRRLEKRAADLEAYFSSHIEGARSTLDEALAFMKTGKKRSSDESLQMIVNNRRALDTAAHHIGKPVNDALIWRLQSILTENTHKDRPITRGAYRHGPVYVVNARGEAVYEGPPAKMVPELMRNFIAWLKASTQSSRRASPISISFRSILSMMVTAGLRALSLALCWRTPVSDSSTCSLFRTILIISARTIIAQSRTFGCMDGT